MSENKKLEQNEMQSIEELRNQSTDLIFQFGQVEMETMITKKRLSELENSLKEKVYEAGDIAVEKAFEDAAIFGDANVKVNLLTAEQYAAKGFEESEGVFVQKAGEIFINTDILRTTKSQNVVVHEVGHKLVLGALKDTAGNLTPNGERILTEFRELIPEQQKKIVEDALSKNYGNKSRKEQLEEFFTVFSEKLADGQIQLGAGGKAISRFCISYISPILPVLLITTISCSLLYPYSHLLYLFIRLRTLGLIWFFKTLYKLCSYIT